MSATAGGTLFRVAEAAGQDRPDDSGEAAHGSTAEVGDGGRFQEGRHGGADAGTAIENRNGKIEIRMAAGDLTQRTLRTQRRKEEREDQDGAHANCEDE